MNIKNIKNIMKTKSFKRLKSHKAYRGHYIIDSHRKPDAHRFEGQFFVLVMFFKDDIRDSTLKKYWLEAQREAQPFSEMLDGFSVHEFYGYLKMVKWS